MNFVVSLDGHLASPPIVGCTETVSLELSYYSVARAQAEFRTRLLYRRRLYWCRSPTEEVRALSFPLSFSRLLSRSHLTAQNSHSKPNLSIFTILPAQI